MTCFKPAAFLITVICLILGAQAATAAEFEGCWRQGHTNIHPADGGAPKRIEAINCLSEFGPQLRTRLCAVGAHLVSEYTVTGPDSFTEKIVRNGDSDVPNSAVQSKKFSQPNPNNLILMTPSKDGSSGFSATFFSRVTPSECANRTNQQASKSGSGSTAGQAAGQVVGKGATNVRILRSEQCLITAVAPAGFDFNDDNTTRAAVESVFSGIRPKGCPYFAALLMDSRGQSTCTLHNFNPAFAEQYAPLLCVSEGKVPHAYRQSTPPGSVMNFESGKEFYWNTVASAKEQARKQAEEQRLAKDKAAQEAVAAAKEQELANARANALASLKNAVISTSSKPSEADMKRRIEQQINISSNGFIRLVGFQKQDGLEREIAGMKTYTIEWVAMLEFTQDCVWNKNNFEAAPPPQGTNGILFASSGFQPVKRGQRINLSGTTTMRRTEKGWRE